MTPERRKAVQEAIDRARALPSCTDVEDVLLAALEIVVRHFDEAERDLRDVTAANDAKSQALVRLQTQEKELRARAAPPWVSTPPSQEGRYWAVEPSHPPQAVVLVHVSRLSDQTGRLVVLFPPFYRELDYYALWCGPLVPPPEEVVDAPAP